MRFAGGPVQISFEPGFGAYQNLALLFKGFQFIPYSCEGSRANTKPAPNPGTHESPAESLSEQCVAEIFGLLILAS